MPRYSYALRKKVGAALTLDITTSVASKSKGPASHYRRYGLEHKYAGSETARPGIFFNDWSSSTAHLRCECLPTGQMSKILTAWIQYPCDRHDQPLRLRTPVGGFLYPQILYLTLVKHLPT